MKGNVKKLVLALGVGLLLAGNAVAQDAQIRRDGIWEAQFEQTSRYKSIGNVEGTQKELCQLVANHENLSTVSDYRYTVTDAYARGSSRSWKLYCTFDRSIPPNGTIYNYGPYSYSFIIELLKK